jgi:hypothetical protein
MPKFGEHFPWMIKQITKFRYHTRDALAMLGWRLSQLGNTGAILTTFNIDGTLKSNL